MNLSSACVWPGLPYTVLILGTNRLIVEKRVESRNSWLDHGRRGKVDCVFVFLMRDKNAI